MPAVHVALAVLGGTTGGPATYGRHLVAALRERDDLRLSVLTDVPDLLRAPGVDVIGLPMRGGLDRLRWQHLAVPGALRKLRPDVYHDLKNALPWRCRCPSAVTVHDLAYYTVPETFGPASRLFLRLATRAAVRRAASVIVPSQATADDVARFFPGSRDRVEVIHHGIDPAPEVPSERANEVRHRLGLPEHFVLHVGTIQARKNVDLVIEAVRRLRARGLPHRVVVVGRKGWLAEAAMAEIARDDTAMWLPAAAPADLAALYAMADAFCSPSSYEGFGLAVADALAFGVPCVISDRSSLPELCGSAAIRLRELSAEAVADALAAILLDPARAETLRRSGPERAARFSWARCADQHARVYRRLATPDGPSP